MFYANVLTIVILLNTFICTVANKRYPYRVRARGARAGAACVWITFQDCDKSCRVCPKN